MRLKYAGRILTYIISPVIIAAIFLASYLRLADVYELKTLDSRFHLRPKPATTDNIVLIEIGDDTIKNLGQWPIQRNYHAILIKALTEAGANAIIYDIFFSQPREYDEDLESAIRGSKVVYLPSVFELKSDREAPFASADGYNAKNLERFSSVNKGEGHINIFPDADGKFRRVPLLLKYQGRWHPYISFLATCDYLGIPAKDIRIVPGRQISCGNIKIPLDDSSNMIINFSGEWSKAYKHYSFYDIVQSYLAPSEGQKPILDLNIFRGKVCVVGLTATGTVDLHPNPFESLYPGFGIHAEVFNSIISGRFISRASKETNIAILAFLGLLALITALVARPTVGLLIIVFLEICLRAASILLFNIFGVWIDLFYPTVVLILLYLAIVIYRYIGEWKRTLLMEKELDIAKKIQESFLPTSLPAISGIDISAAMFTARQVGGDLYDFKVFDGSRLGIMIGDVSGKGVPASLFMAMTASEFKFLATQNASPESVLSALNARIVGESTSNLFVTMFYMIFDLKNNKARYSNGAHLPVIYLKPSGETELLDVPEGTPLGLVDSDYLGRDLNINKGDIFVFYTDGVTEAMDSRRELYSEERLIRIIKASNALSAKEMIGAIEKDIRSFEPRSKQHDDITLIVIKMV